MSLAELRELAVRLSQNLADANDDQARQRRDQLVKEWSRLSGLDQSDLFELDAEELEAVLLERSRIEDLIGLLERSLPSIPDRVAGVLHHGAIVDAIERLHKYRDYLAALIEANWSETN